MEPRSTEGSPEPLANFNLRQLRAILHYCDPASPAFGNQTKAVELAGYAGKPGSNQLSVQGSRVFARLKKHAGLGKLLMDTDCSLQRAFGCVSQAMSADIVRVVVADGKAILVNCGPNHPVRLQGAKIAIELHSGILASEKDATEVEDCDENSLDENPLAKVESDPELSGAPAVNAAVPAADGTTVAISPKQLDQTIESLTPAEYEGVLRANTVLRELHDLKRTVAEKLATQKPDKDSDG